MPERHIVNYSSLVGPSRLTTALEINRGDAESHLNQGGPFKSGALSLRTAVSHQDMGDVEL